MERYEYPILVRRLVEILVVRRFFGNGQGWVYHFNHGWLYLEGVDESGFWVYDETLELGKDLYRSFITTPVPAGCMISPFVRSKFWDYAGNGVVSPSKTNPISLRFFITIGLQ